ncbi:ATP-binding protein [bacterium]|nr:ATP-binding protein [bacterium]MCI0605996.1 ATP-binding protein [bacterium]
MNSEPITKNRVEETVEIHLPSMTKHLNAIRMLCCTLAESMGFGKRDSETAALAVEEALTNVIEHSYHGQEGKKMRVIFEMEGDKFTVRILHTGDQIDSSQFVLVDELAHFYKQKKRGGLGVLIMKKCMDEVTYKSGPDQNECCMIKYLKK